MNVLMEQMTWMEFDKRKDEAILILPIGATEQHGPHLPLCVDTVIAKECAVHLAEKINGIVAPVVSYGYKSAPLSGGGPLFPGTIDLNGETLVKLVYDLLCEFIKDGVKKIIVMNAHFENEAFLLEAIDLVSDKYKDTVIIVETNWWDPMPHSVIDEIFDEVPFPGWAFEHAAITETSLMMYFAPELVHEECMIDEKGAQPSSYHKYPIDKDTVPPTGVLATARTSSAEKGKVIVEAVVTELVNITEKVFK
ncbi:MAG: creatininase [Cellulosilyticaceae bacterium]